MPDTGADVSLVSLAFAKRRRLKIDTSEEHRVLLEFADGSTERAIGIVKDVKWSYDSSTTAHRVDVYVLQNLCVDLLLGYDFLRETDAFSTYIDDLHEAVEDAIMDVSVDDEIAWLLNIIKLVDEARMSSRWRKLSEYILFRMRPCTRSC